MATTEIPLTPDNQTFGITLAGTAYQMRLIWRSTLWYLDLMDSTGTPLINGIPLVPGVDLLAQYASLNFGYSLNVICDFPDQEYPTETDLGINSHLYAETQE
ncbi:hypothetical protein GTU79_08850 [Sodalis ligni]|uniref:phage baseplate plug family protein n=1 Tax=Sodalis ligni TaxID=2697027 RepID=UPI00193F9FF0|nr:hypothetical protein [Sodalis ligni]QWA12779.1 hypothetical protein GTU79_08850 [Sodalis ligni]